MRYELLLLDDKFRFKICAIERDGRCDVRDFILECRRHNESLHKRISSLLYILGKNGRHSNQQIVKQVRKGLFELKPDGHRMYYFYLDGDRIVFAHAAKKGTKKVQTKDIEKAESIRDGYLKYMAGKAKS